MYRKVRKRKIREFHSTLITQLVTLLEKNPKDYWSLLEKLSTSNNGNNNNKSPESNISSTEWYEYFKELNKKPDRTSNDIFDELKEIEKNKIYSELDNRITIKEITEAMCCLKNNKTSSFDSILNETLQNSQSFILQSLYKFFNLILSTGKFLQKWTMAILVPIFKKGIKDDPFNYRGIAISSNVCKLFNRIMNCRLNNICLKRNIICPKQIGFCKEKHTKVIMF